MSKTVVSEGRTPSAYRLPKYDPTPIINELRGYVDTWRALPNPSQWQVTPETARLLQHWRQHQFQGVRPFFCQIEAVETAIWLTEVAPKLGAGVNSPGRKFREHLAEPHRVSRRPVGLSQTGLV